ncbi:3HAO dioxygenase, partial [Nyctiprogne leucopyga]|nr:3HAO dioxygenase [Nyctiprogne leucopyga]
QLFYQVKGDMCLKIIENGKQRDIVIQEGEMFLLPARIPHSPQRYANTVGLVIERERLKTEIDGLRYYVGESTNVLFEKWFHCEDLGTQLIPIIQEFFNSRQYQTGKPNPAEVLSGSSLRVISSLFISRNQYENTKRNVNFNVCKNNTIFYEYFSVKIESYGPGTTEKSKKNSDIWIWQLVCASSHLLTNEFMFQYCWKRTEECVALCIAQDPKRKQPY